MSQYPLLALFLSRHIVDMWVLHPSQAARAQCGGERNTNYLLPSIIMSFSIPPSIPRSQLRAPLSSAKHHSTNLEQSQRLALDVSIMFVSNSVCLEVFW